MKTTILILSLTLLTHIPMAHAYNIVNQIIQPGSSVVVQTANNELVSYSCPASGSSNKGWYCTEALNKSDSSGRVIGQLELSGLSGVSKIEAYSEMVRNCPKVLAANGVTDSSICGTLSPSDVALKCKSL